MRRFIRGVVVLMSLGIASVAHGQSGWFDRSDEAKESQPKWLTPVATTTPRLEQEIRWDFFHQVRPDGTSLNSYGGGKGLELIPFSRVEIIAGLPTYLARDAAPDRNGFADWPLLVKYRLVARDADHGDGILTAFFAMTLPTGTRGNGAAHAVLAPTIAYGKGFGRFDVQGTFGVTLPVADAAAIGRAYVSNTAFQYHVVPRIWPEVEVNATWFQQGRNDGRQQVFITPGVVIGRLPLAGRVGLTVGAGVQLAVSEFRTSTRSLILSIRTPF